MLLLYTGMNDAEKCNVIFVEEFKDFMKLWKDS